MQASVLQTTSRFFFLLTIAAPAWTRRYWQFDAMESSFLQSRNVQYVQCPKCNVKYFHEMYTSYKLHLNTKGSSTLFNCY